MELDKAIKSRESVRKFSDKKPDWRKIIECIDYARYAPMAGNLFSLKFIIVSDKEKIQKIADSSEQDFVGHVDYIVVACTDPFKTTSSYGERGERYCKQQAGAAIQNFLLATEKKGLDTCWVGHFDDDEIKNILDIPKNVEVEAIFPIGFKQKSKIEEEKERKIEIDKILYFDNYGSKKMNKPRKVEA